MSQYSHTSPWTASRARLHGGAVFAATLTFLLICLGGLVTSHGAGMSVPDWPNSFGYNMFAFPPSRWLGGIFYEHTHRLVATTVGLITAVLAGWLWVRETKGKTRWAGILLIVVILGLLGAREFWIMVALGVLAFMAAIFSLWQQARHPGTLRWYGMALFAAVILQGILGGLRVVLFADQIGIFHALLAQSFLVGMVLLALVTSRSFVERRWAEYEPHPGLFKWVLATTALIFLQLGLGATMRHQHMGLSIPDFPLAYGQVWPETSAAALSAINAARQAHDQVATTAIQIWLQMTHRLVACLVLAAIVTVYLKARWTTPRTRRLATLWLAMVLAQIGLGAWTIWSNKAADIATTHMALGALLLVVGAVLTFRLYLGGRTQDFAWPDAPKRPLMDIA